MPKCLDTIQMLRFMAEPLLPENADIAAHLFVCDKCWNAYNQLQNNTPEECEYVPEEGDDQGIEQGINSLSKEQFAMKDYFDFCQEWILGLLADKNAPQQLTFGSPRSSDPKLREYQEPIHFVFESLEKGSSYEWQIDLYLPSLEEPSTDIRIDIKIQKPDINHPAKTLYLHGIELPIENEQIVLVSAERYLKAKKSNEPIYIKFAGYESHVYGVIRI